MKTSRRVLASLASLPSRSARAGAEALTELAYRYKLQRIDELLSSSIERRERSGR